MENCKICKFLNFLIENLYLKANVNQKTGTLYDFLNILSWSKPNNENFQQSFGCLVEKSIVLYFKKILGFHKQNPTETRFLNIFVHFKLILSKFISFNRPLRNTTLSWISGFENIPHFPAGVTANQYPFFAILKKVLWM